MPDLRLALLFFLKLKVCGPGHCKSFHDGPSRQPGIPANSIYGNALDKDRCGP